MTKYERAYGSVDPIPLVVYAQDGIALEADAVVAGDVMISKDGGTFAQTSNAPTAVGTDAYLWWTPTVAEMQCKVAVVRVQEVSGSVFAPSITVIETYGNASSQHPDGTVDANVTTVTSTAAATVADKLLGRHIAGGSDGGRDVTSALRVSRNKVSKSGSTITVYEEDDTSTAWTATVTTAAGDPITEIDPA